MTPLPINLGPRKVGTGGPTRERLMSMMTVEELRLYVDLFGVAGLPTGQILAAQRMGFLKGDRRS